jgi:polar amino acid transport system substrate-binding protein
MGNTKSIALIASVILCLSAIETIGTPKPSVLQKIENNGVIKLGIREDAPPFGYLDSQDNLKGYCLDFFSLLRDKLTTTLNRDIVVIKLLKSRANNRFDLVKQGAIDLECGPNTIDLQRKDDIVFSTSFFVTGTQFLLDRQKLKNIDLDGTLENVSLGVIANTVTENTIRQRYPLAQIKSFEGTNPRSRGVTALQQGIIDAMISDGILLRAEAQRQRLPTQTYPLIPEKPLTCDRYGMILNGGDAEWKSFIDEVILSREARGLLHKWFAGVIPDLKIAAARCKEINGGDN